MINLFYKIIKNKNLKKYVRHQLTLIMNNIPMSIDKNSNIYTTDISYINPIISLTGNLIMFMTKKYFITCQRPVNVQFTLLILLELFNSFC